MKTKGLKLDVITFNTLLKKASQHQQPLQIFLSLLDEMIHLKIKPQVGSKRRVGRGTQRSSGTLNPPFSRYF